MEAKKLVANSSPLEIAVLLSLVWRTREHRSYQVTPGQVLAAQFLHDAMACIPDVPRDYHPFDQHDEFGDGEEEDQEWREAERSRLQDRERESRARIAEVLNDLEGEGVGTGPHSEVITMDSTCGESLRASMLDAEVRLGLERNELIRYVFDALDVAPNV